MPTEIGRDDDEFEDWTVDPSDPEPRFVDLDNPSEEESATYNDWMRRNHEVLGRRALNATSTAPMITSRGTSFLTRNKADIANPSTLQPSVRTSCGFLSLNLAPPAVSNLSVSR